MKNQRFKSCLLAFLLLTCVAEANADDANDLSKCSGNKGNECATVTICLKNSGYLAGGAPFLMQLTGKVYWEMSGIPTAKPGTKPVTIEVPDPTQNELITQKCITPYVRVPRTTHVMTVSAIAYSNIVCSGAPKKVDAGDTVTFEVTRNKSGNPACKIILETAKEKS